MRRAIEQSPVVSARECVLSAPITVLAYPSPFKPATRRVFEFAPTLSVEEIVERIPMRIDAPWDLRAYIQGVRIPNEEWADTFPNPGTVVVVRAIPKGGDQGKAILQIVLGVALFVAAAAIAIYYPAGAYPLGLTGFSLLTLGISGLSLIASGAYSLAAPPPTVQFSGEIPTSDSRAISAPRNEIRPFAPVPRVFGTYRVFPQYAAKPYTEIVGNDTFLRLLFTFGYGPLEITDLKIAEDLVDNFTNVEYVVHPGYDDDPALSIFTNGVDEEAIATSLESDVGSDPVTRTTELDTYESSVDLVFPGGLIAFDEDDSSPRNVQTFFTIEYRAAGSADPWVGVTVTAPLGPGITELGSGDIKIEARERGLVARGIRWVYPSAGQWEVRITRDPSTTSADLGTLIDECTWSILRSIRPGTKPRVPNLSLLEMRIRATDQLSGLIQNLSAMCTSILPVWNGIDGWGPDNRLSSNTSLQPTRNPAWALAEMLRGGVNYRPVPDENIDTTSIAEWAVTNTDEGRNFDAVVDIDTTIGEVCRNIAGSARTSLNIIDGRYGVVEDKPKPTIVAQFSARDSSGFSSTKVFSKEIHGLRVRFVNPDAGYEPDERVVYADGFNESNATEFGTLDLWGVTDSDRAYQDGRYHMAAGKLRPEVYSFDLDISQLIVTRGDRVLYSHDVILVGIGSGLVRGILTAGPWVVGVTVEETIEFDSMVAYAVRIRHRTSGEITLHTLYNPGTDSNDLLFLTAIDPVDAPEVGDLAAWGEVGKETGDYIVQSVSPTSDLGARIELVDYSPAIFDSDLEVIPPFDPNITDPRPRIVITPSKPAIGSVSSDESVLIRDPDGSFRPRILVTATAKQGDSVQAEYLQAQYRTSVPVGEWFSAPQVAAATTRISIEQVDEGELYDIRVRAISGGDAPGRASEWVTVFGHLVIGASTPPPDVESLRVDPGQRLVWEYPITPRDFAGFRVRHQAGTDTLWTTAIPAHDGLVTETLFDISALPPGERTILVKGFDAAGNESATAAYVITDIGGLAIENIVESEDYHAGGFAGTKTDCTVEGGSGDLIADTEADLFWASHSPLFWVPGATLFWGSAFKAMVYEDEWTPPGTAIPGRLFLQVSAVGSWKVYYREQGSTPWIRWPGFIDAEASTTYEFRLEIDGGSTRGRVTEFTALIDKPDVEENLEDVVIASTGTVRLSLTKTFTVIKQVLATVQDDSNGAVTIRVLDKSASLGPSVAAYSDTSTRVQGLADFRVRGYN